MVFALFPVVLGLLVARPCNQVISGLGIQPIYRLSVCPETLDRR